LSILQKIKDTIKDQIFTLIKIIIYNLIILLILTPQLHLFAQEQVKPEELFELSLEDLINTDLSILFSSSTCTHLRHDYFTI